MWRLLPNALCNKSTGCLSQRKIFFLQLVFLVFFLHLFIFGLYALGTFLFSHKEKFDISLSNKAVTYVLLPLQRNGDKKQSLKLGVQSSKKSQVISMQTYLDKKSNGSKKSVVTALSAKKTDKKTVKNSVKLAKTKQEEKVSIVIQDDVKKSKLKKAKSSTVMQETVDVAIENLPKDEKQKNELNKIEEKIQEPEIVPAEIVSEITKADQEFEEENVIFVGSQELQHHMIGSKIQQTIQQHWIVPIGMNPGTSCEIQVRISDSGKADDLRVVKSSGVLVYDSCARKTLTNIEYPNQVWNKTITIVLGAT